MTIVAARMPKSTPKLPKIQGIDSRMPTSSSRAKVPRKASSIHHPMTGSVSLEAR